VPHCRRLTPLGTPKMHMEKTSEYALSIKQPWATLIVHGVKSIEVRSWPTARRGRVYIHAARIADDRTVGWKLVPAQAKDMADLKGGLIGIAEITNCFTYTTREEFARDQELHRNDPSWFTGKKLYGFSFASPEIVPFQSLPGWMRFFSVTATPPRKMDQAKDERKLF
jgi:hypothetical protein